MGCLHVRAPLRHSISCDLGAGRRQAMRTGLAWKASRLLHLGCSLWRGTWTLQWLQSRPSVTSCVCGSRAAMCDCCIVSSRSCINPDELDTLQRSEPETQPTKWPLSPFVAGRVLWEAEDIHSQNQNVATPHHPPPPAPGSVSSSSHTDYLLGDQKS